MGSAARTEVGELSAANLATLSGLVDALAACDVTPASVTAEWRYTDQSHPYVNVWLCTRSDLEAVAAELGLRVESGVRVVGQRHYWTRGDGPGALLQAVSFPHHDDYEGAAS